MNNLIFKPVVPTDTVARLEIGNQAKIELIRQFQRIEGNLDCCGSSYVRVCNQFECLWREACLAMDGTSMPCQQNGQRENMRVMINLLRRNQALMQNSMEGIHVMDIEGNVIEVNDAFCRMLGYTRDEAMRLNVKDWDDQFSAEELRVRFREFIGKSDVFDTVHRRKDGSLLEVEICTTGVELDGEGYLFASSRDITERKRAQVVQQRHNRVIETAMDGFWMTDAQGVLEEANESYARMSGYTMQELVGMHISQLEASEQPEDVKAHLDKLIAQGYDRFETRHRCKDGNVIDIEVSATFLPESKKLCVFCRDITRRKQDEQALRVAAATFETHDAILITDARSNIIRVNRAFTNITGYTADEVIGKNPRIMSSGRQDKAFYAAMWQQILATDSWAGEIWDRRKNGEVYPKWMTITAVKDERGETTQYVAIFSDITARKQIEDEVRQLAFYDTLTGLPNRRLLNDRLCQTMAASKRSGCYGAVMFLDLDNFKPLNDMHGHVVGDLLLIEAAARLKRCVREMDTVARFGGDEFVVMIGELCEDKAESTAQVEIVAEKIRTALSAPYRLAIRHERGGDTLVEHHCTTSIGAVVFINHEGSREDILDWADAAMYQAKQAGRNSIRFYDWNA